MSVELWFLLTLVVAQLYDWRAGRDIDREIGSRRLDYGVAIGLGALFASSGILVAKFDLLAKLTAVQDKRALLVMVGAFTCYRLAHLGIRFWFPRSWSPVVGHAVALLIVACYFSRPTILKPQIYNNVLLLFCAVGLGCYVGRWATRRFAYVFYLLLVVYDVYAVWYSDIMQKLIENGAKIDVVPVGFLIMAVDDFGLGMGDVLFAVMGAMIIRRQVGVGWSLIASALYLASMRITSVPLVVKGLELLHIDGLSFFPLMVTISPITLACLWLVSRRQKPS